MVIHNMAHMLLGHISMQTQTLVLYQIISYKYFIEAFYDDNPIECGNGRNGHLDLTEDTCPSIPISATVKYITLKGS